jgi:hypothetical protein
MKPNKKPTWESPSPEATNIILDGGTFFVSFNPHPCAGIPFFNADHNSAETALVDRRLPVNLFHILNGDFRKQYEKAFPKGWDACLAVYLANKKAHDSSWSSNARIHTYPTTYWELPLDVADF